MEIKEITNKEEWEGFLEICAEKTFLQSWSWGEFNLKMGNKIWKFGIFSNAMQVGAFLVVKVLARRGTFLYIPHGPVVLGALTVKDKKEILELLLSRLNQVAKEEKASFIRVSPIFLDTEENRGIFEDLGFRNSPMPASAYEATWKLDITSGADLLHNMRKTTRYLIKKCTEDTDISVEISSDFKNIEIYQELNKKVAKRQKFVPFSDQFIKNEFEIFSKDNQAVFVFGKYKGEIAAGAMIIFWQGVAFYHQAASLAKFAKYSIPYLMQWEAIKEAERRGCKIYDFWGFTDPIKYPRHPWAGPTLFKMGFGGYKEEYVKTQDFIISQKYWVNYIIEKIRKLKRNL
jgi:lipid II:glycine glycyltransferase (peptidoglycan interpeptide bridge formation enzyme)